MRHLSSLVLAGALVGASLLALPQTSGATSSSIFPAVSTKWGVKPTITFPDTKAPTVLAQEVIHHGSGPLVKSKDLLITNYVAQIWRGKVFDTSWGHDPGAFPIGVGLVIPGWDKELVKDHVGDRVVLVVPPVDGYGSSGLSAAGITGTDTLVFVIDIDAQYPNSGVRADPHATKVSSGVKGITVTGAITSAPKIALVKSTPQPKTTSITVLWRGHGKAITPGVVVMQLEISDWTGATVGSTWTSGSPTGQPVRETGEPGAFDNLVGIPLGSRVLLQVPKNSSGQGPYAVVADLSSEPFHGVG